MAAKKHEEMVLQGAGTWNEWRTSNGVQIPDLEGADLSVDSVGPLGLEGVNLAGAILRRAFLNGQRLARSDFQNADMRFANLRSVDLDGADLRNANLQEAQLQPALVPFEEDLSSDPTGAMNNLARAVESEGGSFTIEQEGKGRSYSLPPHFIVRGQRMGRPSTLKMATLDGANLGRANLARSVFTKASLRNADLDGATLEEVVLVQADLTGANLRAVKLTELSLAASELQEFPIEIIQLSALRVLNLKNNRIARLPSELVVTCESKRYYRAEAVV
jgi:uncharacterized protein YjbI with pentapeptide repeats